MRARRACPAGAPDRYVVLRATRAACNVESRLSASPNGRCPARPERLQVIGDRVAELVCPVRVGARTCTIPIGSFALSWRLVGLGAGSPYRIKRSKPGIRQIGGGRCPPPPP